MVPAIWRSQPLAGSVWSPAFDSFTCLSLPLSLCLWVSGSACVPPCVSHTTPNPRYAPSPFAPPPPCLSPAPLRAHWDRLPQMERERLWARVGHPLWGVEGQTRSESSLCLLLGGTEDTHCPAWSSGVLIGPKCAHGWGRGHRDMCSRQWTWYVETVSNNSCELSTKR